MTIHGGCSTKLPPKAATLLNWWWKRAHTILGTKAKCVIVTGSIPLNDFAPGWSDVDVCVVLNSPVTESQAAQLNELHDEMHAKYVLQRQDGWRSGQAIEAVYMSAALCPDFSGDDPCFVAMGGKRGVVAGTPHSPFDRYILSHFQHYYWGEPIVFDAPSRGVLAEQALKDLHLLADVENCDQKSAVYLAGMIHWIVRSIVFWRDGKMLGKSQALRCEIENQSLFSEAYQLALHCREQGSAQAADYHEQLCLHFRRIALPACEQMKKLLKNVR